MSRFKLTTKIDKGTDMVEELFDGGTLKAILQGAEQSIEAHIDELNLMNVFPVPDGDTGINMFITLQAANRAVAGIADDSAALVSAAAARGALLGASGNSGVILSQILRGIAKGMELKERFSCAHFAKALQTATEMACRAVTNPVEGTILTVSRESSIIAVRMAERGASLKQILSAMVAQAKKTVKKTPELLPQLKEAGVVDAGGKGLFYVFQGMHDSLHKHITRPETLMTAIMKTTPKPVSYRYGFDVQFLVMGNGLSLAEIRRQIETMGESVIVVGDNELIRVHVHTMESDAVLDYARGVGEVTDVSIVNMDEQVTKFRQKYHYRDS